MSPTINHLGNHPLIRRLVSLDLNRRDFVIFGSGPLLAHGIREQIADLDIVARGSAWKRAYELGIPAIGHSSGAPIIHFWGGRIEVFSEWNPRVVNTDKLIDQAKVIAGLRFARMEHVLAYKRSLRRPKDMKDINALEEWFGFSKPNANEVGSGVVVGVAPLNVLPDLVGLQETDPRV